MAERVPQTGSGRWPRYPILYAAISFAFGIALDRVLADHWTTWRWEWLGLFNLLAMACWLICYANRFSISTACLCLLLTLTGAHWHHTFWQIDAANHISCYAEDQSRPLRLEAVVISKPVLLPNRRPDFAAAWPGEDRTRCQLRAVAIHRAERIHTTCGQLQLTVSGNCDKLSVGRHVLITGTVRNLTPARNPLVFDYAEMLRRKSIRTTMYCEHADGIHVLKMESSSLISIGLNGLGTLRGDAHSILTEALPAESATIAVALLLGERYLLEDEVTTAFQRSGLMHLISISGLHVALIGLIACGFGRWLGRSPRVVNLLTLSGMTLAWLLAENRPPVFRAWLFSLVMIWSWTTLQPLRAVQLLSLVGWICLIINPSWLFDPGAQLSFLACVAILGCWQWFPNLFSERDEITQSRYESESVISPDWIGPALWIFKRLRESAVISLSVVLLVLPVLSQQFRIISLAGILGTVLSLPLLLLILPGLFLLVFVGAMLPRLAHELGWLIHGLIQCFVQIANWFSNSPLQWTSVRIPVVIQGFLVLMGLAFVLLPRSQPGYRKAILACWWTIAIMVGCSSWNGWGSTEKLEVRVLSVGHGNACLVTCPNGRTIVLDAGSLQNGEYAADAIAASLFDLRVDRIDAILISHTDSDHLNAVPFLLNRLPVKSVLLNPVGLNPQHRGMAAVIEAARAEGVDLNLLRLGDEIQLDEQVTITLLHCPDSPLPERTDDNEHSAVVSVEYAGRRILFPGDISGQGQTDLIQRDAGGWDVLVAPHHGGLNENTETFAAWACPEQVIVSSGEIRYRQQLQEVYSKSELLWTATGAVRCQMESSGELRIQQWQPGQSWSNMKSLNDR